MKRIKIFSSKQSEVTQLLKERGYVAKWKDGYLIVSDSKINDIYDILSDGGISFIINI